MQLGIVPLNQHVSVSYAAMVTIRVGVLGVLMSRLHTYAHLLISDVPDVI